jgi:hypothetical protein
MACTHLVRPGQVEGTWQLGMEYELEDSVLALACFDGQDEYRTESFDPV